MPVESSYLSFHHLLRDWTEEVGFLTSDGLLRNSLVVGNVMPLQWDFDVLLYKGVYCLNRFIYIAYLLVFLINY